MLPPSSCFTCRRLNATTFVIVEGDKWHENPFIYAKVYESAIVLLDTGCGGAAEDPDVELTSLRHFIETYPLPDNDNSPLNPGAQRSYVVVCTHCHYDHIGGIGQFRDAPNLPSGPAPMIETLFRERGDYRQARFVDLVTHWATDGERIRYGPDGQDLGLVVYHAPGHTPDELAVWDPKERVLFVGDTAYEWAPILFPLEASIPLYLETLERLGGLVRELNAGLPKSGDIPSMISNSPDKLTMATSSVKRITLASGHITSDIDAEDFLGEVHDFLCRVAGGGVQPKDRQAFRGEEEELYEREDGRISFAGAKRMFRDFIGNASLGYSSYC